MHDVEKHALYVFCENMPGLGALIKTNWREWHARPVRGFIGHSAWRVAIIREMFEEKLRQNREATK